MKCGYCKTYLLDDIDSWDEPGQYRESKAMKQTMTGLRMSGNWLKNNSKYTLIIIAYVIFILLALKYAN